MTDPEPTITDRIVEAAHVAIIMTLQAAAHGDPEDEMRRQLDRLRLTIDYELERASVSSAGIVGEPLHGLDANGINRTSACRSRRAINPKLNP